MWYESSERCVCKCGYEDVAENIDMDPHLLCVRCPKCNELMSVIELKSAKLNLQKAKAEGKEV